MSLNSAIQQKLTERQGSVIEALEAICRRNVLRYKESCNHLYQDDLRKLAAGDAACVFGGGGLTFQVGHALGIKASSVLSVFKSLERKGLVIREKPRGYLCALYWWPVGLAASMKAEIEREDGHES